MAKNLVIRCTEESFEKVVATMRSWLDCDISYEEAEEGIYGVLLFTEEDTDFDLDNDLRPRNRDNLLRPS